MSVVNQWIEEDYFTSLCIILDNIGIIDDIEGTAHLVMDAWTVDGVLDTESLDGVIDKMIGTD